MAKTRMSKRVLLVVNLVALVGLSATTGLLFMKNRDLNSELNLPSSEREKRDNDKVVSEVAKLMDLPDSEPTVIVINDPDEVKRSEGSLEKLVASLFDNIQKGDYVIFYIKDRSAIQYRPSDKKIIKTTAVSIPITVELIGSEAAMGEAEEKLKDFGNQITIVKTKTDGITQSFVFDVDQDQKEEADSIAKQLATEVGTTLPAGFTPASTTEVVIAVSTASSLTPTATPDTAPTTEQQP